MRKHLYCFLTVVLISSISFSQMKLNLSSVIDEEENASNLKLVLDKTETQSSSYSTIESPADATSLIPGTIMLGLLGDVTFPFGEAFKTYAGTGWSVHGMGAYVLNPIALALKVGYIRFGEVETDLSFLEKSTQYGEILKAYNSQVVITAALIYFLSGLSSSCVTGTGLGNLNPYLGLALCLIFKNYVSSLVTNYGLGKVSNTLQLEQEYEESSTIFAISPSVGTLFHLSKDISLILSADYYYLFDEADVDAANINYLSITFGAAYSIL